MHWILAEAKLYGDSSACRNSVKCRERRGATLNGNRVSDSPVMLVVKLRVEKAGNNKNIIHKDGHIE